MIYYFIEFIFLIIFSPFKLVFQPTEKKKSDDVIVGLYGGCGVRLNRETSSPSWVTLAVWTLALSI
jgi:glutamate mutase epsilon subunit